MTKYKFTKEELTALRVVPIPVKNIVTQAGKVVPLKVVVGHPKPALNLYGVEDTLKAIDLIAAISNGLYKAALGKWKLNWYQGIIIAAPIIYRAIPLLGSLYNIPNELDDLNDKEKEYIVEKVKAKLTFSDNAESVIALSLDTLYRFKLLFGIFK